MPSRAVIDDFLEQEHLAFVGVSRQKKEFANQVYRHLRDGGRTMYPVNGNAADLIEGDASYRRVSDVPDPVDGLVVMVPDPKVADVVAEEIDRGIPRIWLHRGAGQRPVPADAVAIAEQHGVAVVDGACPLMFDHPVGALHKAHGLLIRRRFTA
jgi:predicted CoA-binding protein